MLSTVILLCFSLQAKSFSAAEQLTTPAVGGGSDVGIENVVHDFMKTSQELQVNVSLQHPEGNSGGEQEEEWRIKKITHMLGTDFQKNEDEMEIKEDKLRDHAEGERRKKEDAVERKGTEEKGKENTVENSKPNEENAKPRGVQTSGWYWAAETLNVTTIPVITYPLHLPLTDPPTGGDFHPSHQHSAAEKVNVTLEFRVEGHRLVLDLHPTRDLLGATYREPAIGTNRDGKPPVECEFQGNIRGVHGSWVALSLCGGIRGVIVGRALELIVEPIRSASSLKEPHRVYSTKLLPHSFGTCGVKSGDKKNSKRKHSTSSSNISKEKVDAILHRERREALHGGPLWINKTTRFVELVLLADHSFYLTYGNETAAHCRAIVNIVNALYRPLGVVVVLTHLEIWDTKDKIEVNEDSNKTIDNMKPYRKELLSSLPNVPNDNTQLLTTVDFTGTTIGKATMNGMCSYEDSVGIVQDQKFGPSYVAQTLAHEIGHNLGLGHDDDEEGCKCDTNSCIMNTSRDRHSPYISWSSCSRKNVTISLKAFSFDCLKNVPSKLFSGSICGNGIVDEGEECDCGPPEYCENPCCTAGSCTLVVNASCASGACCDTQTCKPKPVWMVCRAEVDECDIPEYCPGNSEFCPPDVIERDGTSCRGNKGHCYKGECGSHEGRCQQVWGESASAGSPQCYTHSNMMGDSRGNCGILDKESKTFQPCSADDVFCGTLHCHTDVDMKPKFGLVSYTVWDEDNRDCRKIISSDIPPSYWLSPNGAPCGDGQMCVNQRCVPIPGLNLGMLFCFLLVLLLFAMCCMWDHLRWCWEKKGRACLSPHCPYCASCLDTCCCPLMSKIFRCCWYPLMLKIIQRIKNICPFSKSKKSSPKEVVPGSKEANGTVISQMDQSTGGSSQINSWTKANGQLVVKLPTSIPYNSSNSSLLHHNNVDTDHTAHNNSIAVVSECASRKTPLLNQVIPANNCFLSPGITEGHLSRTTPTSQAMLTDNVEVVDKLSELTQNLSILSGKENNPQNASMDENVECIDKICESSSQQILPPPGSCTSSVKIVPVRKAPLPPVQSSVQDRNGKPSEPVMDSGVHPTILQKPEPSIPPRPELTIPTSPEPATSPRQEPEVPPRPEPIAYSKPEPVVPLRPECIIPPRPESATTPRQEPVMPPRPEPIAYSKAKPVIPLRPECITPPRPEPVVPPRPEFSHPSRLKPTIPPRP